MEKRESLSKKILISLSCALLIFIAYVQFVGMEVGYGYISVDESEHRLYPPYTPKSKIYWTWTNEYSYPNTLKGHSGAIWYYQPYLAMFEYKYKMGRGMPRRK